MVGKRSVDEAVGGASNYGVRLVRALRGPSFARSNLQLAAHGCSLCRAGTCPGPTGRRAHHSRAFSSCFRSRLKGHGGAQASERMACPLLSREASGKHA